MNKRIILALIILACTTALLEFTGTLNGKLVAKQFNGNITILAPTCSDGYQNGNETGRDCGLAACGTACPTCSDGILNQNETDIDCGGPYCSECTSCSDGIQNQNETGIDCGGPCNACASSSSGSSGSEDEEGNQTEEAEEPQREPEIKFSVSPQTFSVTGVKGTAKDRSVTIKNEGKGTITAQISLAGSAAPFIDVVNRQTLVAGQSKTIPVHMRLEQKGTFAGQIRFLVGTVQKSILFSLNVQPPPVITVNLTSNMTTPGLLLPVKINTTQNVTAFIGLNETIFIKTELIDPKTNQTVAVQEQYLRGDGGSDTSIAIPDNLPEGEYIVKITTEASGSSTIQENRVTIAARARQFIETPSQLITNLSRTRLIIATISAILLPILAGLLLHKKFSHHR